MTTTLDDMRMMSLLCAACNEIFAIPARRGRPPKFCSKCGGDPDTVDRVTSSQDAEEKAERLISANERIDRLEMLLKSRGTHISQNQQSWRDKRMTTIQVPWEGGFKPFSLADLETAWLVYQDLLDIDDIRTRRSKLHEALQTKYNVPRVTSMYLTVVISNENWKPE